MNEQQKYYLTIGLGGWGFISIFLNDLTFFSFNGIPASLIAALICAFIFRGQASEETAAEYKPVLQALCIGLIGCFFTFSFSLGGLYFSTAYAISIWAMYTLYKAYDRFSTSSFTKNKVVES